MGKYARFEFKVDIKLRRWGLGLEFCFINKKLRIAVEIGPAFMQLWLGKIYKTEPKNYEEVILSF